MEVVIGLGVIDIVIALGMCTVRVTTFLSWSVFCGDLPTKPVIVSSSTLNAMLHPIQSSTGAPHGSWEGKNERVFGRVGGGCLTVVGRVAHVRFHF